MKTRTIGLIACLVGLSALPALAKDLRVGSECTYPPFNYRDAKGELQGFDIDIAREVGKRMNVELSFVCQAWEGMIPGLLAGKYDVILASMSITPDRLKSIDFSIPYRSSSGRFAGTKSLAANSPFKADGSPNPDIFKGKTVGIQRSSQYHRYITEKFPTVQVSLYDTVDNMLLDLKAGRVDAVMLGPIKLAADFLDKPDGANFAFIGPEVDDVSYFGPGVGAGIRKGDGAIKESIDKALAEIIKDGTFKQINQKYWKFSVLGSAWKN